MTDFEMLVRFIHGLRDQLHVAASEARTPEARDRFENIIEGVNLCRDFAIKTEIESERIERELERRKNVERHSVDDTCKEVMR